MNTFLPTAYNFSLNHLINYNNYNNGMVIQIVLRYIISIIFGLVAGLGALMVLYKIYDACKSKKSGFKILGDVIFECFLAYITIICFSFVSLNQNQWYTDSFVEQDFRYPVTHNDFIVKCVDTNKNNSIPKNIHDNKKYPYELHVKTDDWAEYYLGTMKNGRFIPAETYIAGVFYKYLQYINKHHLENKFTNNAYFIKSSKYLDGNKVQWILTNKHDTVLHLADNTVVEQSNVVKN